MARSASTCPSKEAVCSVGGICPPNPLTRMPFLPTASSGASWHDFVNGSLFNQSFVITPERAKIFEGYEEWNPHESWTFAKAMQVYLDHKNAFLSMDWLLEHAGEY